MKVKFLSFCITLFAANILFAQNPEKVTMQTFDNILDDGTAYLFVEGEDVAEFSRINSAGDPLEITTDEARFIIVSKDDPIQTIKLDQWDLDVVSGGLDVLTEDAQVSNGAALFDNWFPDPDRIGLNAGANTARWQLQFEIPATYFMYFHYTMYNRDNNTNFLNEDSVYVPPAFNSNSRGDWLGFEGTKFDTDEVEIGNSDRDGWMPLPKDVVDKGEVTTNDDATDDFWNGNFHWALRNEAVNMDADSNWVDDKGMTVQYEVTEEMVGQVIDFEISVREPYGAIDGILFATSDVLLEEYTQASMDEFFLDLSEGPSLIGDFDNSGALDLPDVNMLNNEIAGGTNNAAFDLTGDGTVDIADLKNWVSDQRKTWVGDANLDNEFNSSDLVVVFAAGQFELDADAGWEQGDWTGDRRFNSSDLVAAFVDGGFELGPKSVAAVPEPHSFAMMMFMALACLARFRRKR